MAHGPIPPGDPADGQALPSRRRTRPSHRIRRPDESLLVGGLSGIALVTAATVGLVLAGALIAGIVALLYS